GFKGNIRERKEWRTPNSTWVELAGQSCIFIISIVYLPPGGTVDDFKVTLAAIEKRILDVVKEGRPLIIGGDWNARVGKGWNGRGESTYNARGKVLVESFKRLALSLPQLEEEAPVFTWRAGKRKSIVDYVVAWRWTGKVVGDRWQAWTDHRPLVVELKDPADNCGGVWMERWKWKSYSEEDRKRRWREYKRGCKRFFKGEEWKAMVKKTREGAATVEDLWSKWKKGLWDCAMRWFAELTSLNKQVVIAHAQWLREGKNDGKAREEFVELRKRFVKLWRANKWDWMKWKRQENIKEMQKWIGNMWRIVAKRRAEPKAVMEHHGSTAAFKEHWAKLGRKDSSIGSLHREEAGPEGLPWSW
ncbi:hypothetical protein QOT17_025380, partial [Balamuthia mandrillaris]